MYGAAPRFRTRPPLTTHPDTPPAAKPAQASTGANFSLLLQLHEAVGGKAGWRIVRAACIDAGNGRINAAACLAFFNGVQPLFDAVVRVLAVGLTSDDEELSENAHYMLLYDIVSPAGNRYNATVARDAKRHASINHSVKEKIAKLRTDSSSRVLKLHCFANYNAYKQLDTLVGGPAQWAKIMKAVVDYKSASVNVTVLSKVFCGIGGLSNAAEQLLDWACAGKAISGADSLRALLHKYIKGTLFNRTAMRLAPVFSISKEEVAAVKNSLAEL
jgi:hypothetical protein